MSAGSRLAGLKRTARRRQASTCSRCGRAAAVAPLVVTQGSMTLCECCWMSLVDSPGTVRLPLEAQAPLPADEGHEELRPRRPFNPPHPKEMA